MVIDSIIFFCIFTSSTFLNVKKAIAEKGNYLLSWNNQLEIIYTLLFLAQFGIDAARFS